jgi:fluoride exporter
MIWWAVALGAVVGAPARYLLDLTVTRRTARRGPWGTLTVNVLGSAVLGIAAGLVARGHLSTLGYALVGTGFCGSFTTFSSFVWETFALVEDRRSKTAWTNVGLTLVIGVGIAYLAFELTTATHL